MNSYGEDAAMRLMDEHAIITMAALDGNLDAIKALLAVVAQTAYTDGYGAAASTAGVTL